MAVATVESASRGGEAPREEGVRSYRASTSGVRRGEGAPGLRAGVVTDPGFFDGVFYIECQNFGASG